MSIKVILFDLDGTLLPMDQEVFAEKYGADSVKDKILFEEFYENEFEQIARMRWAGLNAYDFELYTTYENSHYCKPNLNYYKSIITALNVESQECLMVGNDVGEDMVAEELGMKVFLITDCLINKTDKDISAYSNGNFADLISSVQGCCSRC